MITRYYSCVLVYTLTSNNLSSIAMRLLRSIQMFTMCQKIKKSKKKKIFDLRGFRHVNTIIWFTTSLRRRRLIFNAADPRLTSAGGLGNYLYHVSLVTSCHVYDTDKNKYKCIQLQTHERKPVFSKLCVYFFLCKNVYKLHRFYHFLSKLNEIRRACAADGVFFFSQGKSRAYLAAIEAQPKQKQRLERLEGAEGPLAELIWI